jgi:hypothetical protein
VAALGALVGLLEASARQANGVRGVADALAQGLSVAVLVAYLAHMLQRTFPAGFIAPCLPTKDRQVALRRPMAA